MKKILFIGIILVCIISNIVLVTGCPSDSSGSEPVAKFEMEPKTGEVPLMVTFHNMSENADEFQWDFGDGSTKTTNNVEEDVTHEYLESGDYGVELTVLKSSEPSKTDNALASISVSPGPLANVIVMPENVQLNIGDTQEFTVECMDAYGNVIENYQLSWDVREAAGTISAGTFVAGSKAGSFDEAIVATVKIGGITVTGTASVTINSRQLETVSIMPVEIGAGETKQLEYSAVDEYGNSITGLTPIWSLKNDSVGSITHDGLLTAGKKAGNYSNAVEVKVKLGETEKQATNRVVIVPGKIDQIGIAPESITLGMGMEQQYVAVTADEYGNRITDIEFNWSADSDAGIFTSDGIFTASMTPGNYRDGIEVEATRDGTTVSATGDITIEPDRITYVSDEFDEEGDILELYVIDADGSNKKQLTTLGGNGVTTNAGCSPDGRRIAFMAGDTMYLANTDGTWLTSVYSGTEDLGDLSWSPYGDKIAFTIWERDDADNIVRSNIYTIRVDGSNLVQLIDNSEFDFSPAWSPDGKKIAFVSFRDGNEEIYVMNADGTNQTRITDSGWSDMRPEWSLDGSEIYFYSDRNSYYLGIYKMKADGSDIEEVYAPDGDHAYEPSISPDGSKIAFYMSVSANDFDIWVVNIDGTGKKQLTNNTAFDAGAYWLQRKSGVEVSEDMVNIIDKTEIAAEMTVQEVTALVRDAVVRIETDAGSGSGVIIDSDGFILTCNHVIADAEEITVYLSDGTSYDGTVHGRDPLHDLAVVKIDATGLPALEIGEYDNVELGQHVVVLGFPLGNENLSVTSGLVSAIEYNSGRNITLVQTDSAVNPGNSGGPMFNMKGQIIGIVSTKLVGELIEGIGYAISTGTINLYLPRLLNGETIT
jgi:Tol biopolymer transport system component/PKD repeat protein